MKTLKNVIVLLTVIKTCKAYFCYNSNDRWHTNTLIKASWTKTIPTIPHFLKSSSTISTTHYSKKRIRTRYHSGDYTGEHNSPIFQRTKEGYSELYEENKNNVDTGRHSVRKRRIFRVGRFLTQWRRKNDDKVTETYMRMSTIQAEMYEPNRRSFNPFLQSISNAVRIQNIITPFLGAVSGIRNINIPRINMTPFSQKRDKTAVQQLPNQHLLKNTANEKNDIATRVFKHSIQYFLYERWSKIARNLQIDVKLSPNTPSRLLTQGEVSSSIAIQFGELSLPNLQISGGGHLDINQLNVHLLALVIPPSHPLGRLVRKGGNVRRFLSRFEFHARDCVLDQRDILSSSCIRNGLKALLGRILRRVGFLGDVKVNVNSVNVLPSNKISCTGEAYNELGIHIPFEVRSGLSTTAAGQVLTFPGLELALGTGKTLGVFIPVLPGIDLDIGNDAKVESICIDGEERCIKLSARATVSPKEALFGDSRRTRIKISDADQYIARYACDLGRWVTNLGNF